MHTSVQNKQQKEKKVKKTNKRTKKQKKGKKGLTKEEVSDIIIKHSTREPKS